MTAPAVPHDSCGPPRIVAGDRRRPRRVLWQVEVLAALVVAAVYLAMPTAVPSDEVVHAAEARGAALHAWERGAGLDVELGLQSALAWFRLEAVANWFYGSLHFLVTAAAFVSLLRRRPELYPRWRTAFVLVSVSAFALQRWLPVAPPRLVPAVDGSMLMEDWLATHSSLWSFEAGPISEAANHYAAMPSMHVGWALLSAWALAVGRTGVRRAVVAAYPLLVAIVVMATGNHFLLDVVAGALIALAALAGVELRGRPRRVAGAPSSATVSAGPESVWRDRRRRRRGACDAARTTRAPRSRGAGSPTRPGARAAAAGRDLPARPDVGSGGVGSSSVTSRARADARLAARPRPYSG